MFSIQWKSDNAEVYNLCLVDETYKLSNDVKDTIAIAEDSVKLTEMVKAAIRLAKSSNKEEKKFKIDGMAIVSYEL